MPKPWVDAQSALAEQLSLYQEMCGRASNIASFTQLMDLSVTLKDSVLTDLNLAGLLSELQNQRSQDGSVICETPSLTVLSESSKE
jgi:hypothetical protein